MTARPAIVALKETLSTVAQWVRVSRSLPCRVCGKPDWCARSADGLAWICRRIGNPSEARIDRSGAQYWLYGDMVRTVRTVADGSFQESRERPHRSQPAETHRRLPPDLLDAGYRAVLEALPLDPAHFEELRDRGLTAEEIDHRGYRSITRSRSSLAGLAAVAALGSETVLRLPGIAQPTPERGWWLDGPNGLLIPVRDVDERIVALKVRRDRVESGQRYLYVTSRRCGGPSPGAPVHVPLRRCRDTHLVRLTEGELKADVATALGGILTVSVPGVASWRAAIPVLRALRAREIHLAFDADYRSNPHVARAYLTAIHGLRREGF